MPCSDCYPTFTVLAKLEEYRLSSRTSNQFLLASELIELDELVSQAEKELVRYEETIARLRETIVALTNERRNLNGQAQLAKSLLPPPIRKLPPEVMAQIFIHYGETGNLIKYWGSNYVPGITVASVCSYWRSVALSTTALWNNISVHLTVTHYHLSHVFLIRLLLERSGRSLLSVCIRTNNSSPISPGVVLLLEHANRWQSIDGICMSECVLDALSSLKGRLHSLRAFRLPVMEQPFHRYSGFLENASKLRSLTLHGSRLTAQEVASNRSIPWEQIVNLLARYCSTSTILQLLTKTPNLRVLTIEGKWCRLEHEPHVRSLLNTLNVEILGFMERSMSELSDALNLPELHSLFIHSPQPYRIIQNLQWFNKLSSLISRSSATVTSFTLRNVWAPTNDLLTLLEAMPALTLLSISEPYFGSTTVPMLDNQFLSRINCHLNRQPLLPRLLSVTLEGCRLASFDIRTFVEVIQSRCKPSSFVQDEIACIRTVKLTIPGESIVLRIIQPLVALRQGGLDILIQDMDGDVSLREENR